MQRIPTQEYSLNKNPSQTGNAPQNGVNDDVVGWQKNTLSGQLLIHKQATGTISEKQCTEYKSWNTFCWQGGFPKGGPGKLVFRTEEYSCVEEIPQASTNGSLFTYSLIQQHIHKLLLPKPEIKAGVSKYLFGIWDTRESPTKANTEAAFLLTQLRTYCTTIPKKVVQNTVMVIKHNCAWMPSANP